MRLLVTAFWPGSDEESVDPGASLEYGLWCSYGNGELETAASEIRQMLVRAPTDDAFEKEMTGLGLQVALPEGKSWRAWGEHVLVRVAEAIADPSTIEDDPVQEPFRLPRTSRFTDLDTANTASTLVLRAHEERVRAWSEDSGGWWRLHLYADLGKEVGVVLGRGADGAPAREPVPVSGAVVLLRREPSGQVYIATAYPEAPLDVTVRERFPDLCNVFGGYFGQDMDTVPWEMRNNLLGVTRDPARSRMRTQLADLLTLDDQQLAAAVHSLGSYVLPKQLRPWVRRLWKGIDDYDWTAPSPPP